MSDTIPMKWKQRLPYPIMITYLTGNRSDVPPTPGTLYMDRITFYIRFPTVFSYVVFERFDERVGFYSNDLYSCAQVTIDGPFWLFYLLLISVCLPITVNCSFILRLLLQSFIEEHNCSWDKTRQWNHRPIRI